MSDKVRLTGLWERESEGGSTYLTGNVSPSAQLLILENSYKETQGDPDFIAFLTKNEREEEPEAKEEKEEALL